MQVGDLVHYVEANTLTGNYHVRENTSGLIVGFHPKNGRVKVHWFTMGETPTPHNAGYWPWGSLKVYNNASR